VAEEDVIQMFKEIHIAGTQWYDFKHAVLASTPVGKIGQLLPQDYVFQLLETIVDNSFNHYTHLVAFKSLSLMRDLMSPTSGVSPSLRTTHNKCGGFTPL
jgi:hypothetical protein